MSVIYIVVPVALMIVIGMLIAFFRSVKQGQFDDLDTPAIRMLFDDDPVKPAQKDGGDGSMSKEGVEPNEKPSK